MENEISNPSKKAKPNKGAASKMVCRHIWTRKEKEILINALKEIVAIGMKVDNNTFSSDRATGKFAKSVADTVENMDKEDEVRESVPLDSLGAGGMECSYSVTHRPTVSSEKKKEKKRARAADTLVEGLANFADKLCHVMEKADSRMEFIRNRIGYAHDLSTARKGLNAKLFKLPLCPNDRFSATDLIMHDAEMIRFLLQLLPTDMMWSKIFTYQYPSTSPQGRQWTSPDINPMKFHLHIRMPKLSPNPLDRGKTGPWNLAKLSPLSSPEPPSEYSSNWSELKYCLLLALGRVWRAVCGNDSSQSSMHLRSRNLPKPSASSPPGNRSHPMATPGQAPNLEGLHREIHDMAEQMRIMNENNGRLMQLLAAVNPHFQQHHPSLISSDLATLIVQEIVLKISVPTETAVHRKDIEGSDFIEVQAPRPAQHLRRKNRSDGPSGFVQEPKVALGNRQKNASHLFTVHQKETESLKDFVKRFNQAILEVEDPSDKIIIMAMMEGLRPGPLFDSLSKNVPETLSILQSKADKYIAAKELAEAKRRRSRTPPRRPEFILPPLNAPVAQVLSEIKHEEFVKWPGKIKTDPQKRNMNKYCEFHRDHGHNTEDCFQLKEQIADLIKRGYLRKYVADRLPPNSPERRYGDNRPTAGNIQTIHGGFGSSGYSTSSRKRHARSAFRIKAITSTYHLKMKFPTLTGIGEVKGDQKVARQCFISAMKVGTSVQSAQ
ncbi:hypothetical protein Acr_13g0007800 [Actinidia rufa]|uniref:Retrotransposon gag domain-containing protein n=1 Tax=Actinidia rufa TaxID=165716 RepID=A0A7J0FMJ1_9ERIC|nr:hypothetical protein Acr_13g0007800 [Actinidia rufa]